MKRLEMVVPWEEGLHARQAGKLVRVAYKFASTIQLRCGARIANARSIISILLLCATIGSTVEIEVQGEDEEDAAEAIEGIFVSGE